MTAASVASAAVEVVGGLAASPLTVGLIQHWKARLQGRRGPSPLQPYRELRRLWGKGVVDVTGTTVVYRLAPAVIAASTVAALAVVPASGSGPNLGVGHDFILLAGLLVVARFAAAVSTWDVANGFSLMGASRDLTISVFAEVALLVALAVPAALSGTSDLAAMIAHTSGGRVVVEPGSPPGRGRLRPRGGSRDGPPALRQPRHPPRADHDPRGTPARVRRTRPRLPPLGGRSPALAPAGTGR